MEEFIARENIKCFEAQLLSTTDEVQRARIEALLASERRHLRDIREAKASANSHAVESPSA